MSARASVTAGSEIGLAGLADQCVMCGLCLPHCPTYRLDPTEAESPRGRIALARALATGALQPEPVGRDHLARCLGCLACETVCPSGVQYERILVQARALPGVGPPEDALLDHPRRLTRLAQAAAMLRADRWARPFARVLPAGSRLRRWLETLPTPPAPLAVADVGTAARSAGARRIALLRGCVGSVHERDSLAAARSLLRACGHAVLDIPDGTCCGALPRHRGRVQQADGLAAEVRAAVLAQSGDAALTVSSGCHGDLRAAFADDAGVEVTDIHAFLAADPGFASLRFRTLERRVALHVPCTQANAVGAVDRIRAVLLRIPGLELADLPTQPRCCGAAGAHVVERPDAADQLRAERLTQVAELAPALLLTTNVGCRMHLANGLRDAGGGPPVLHPLALLARQLDNRRA